MTVFARPCAYLTPFILLQFVRVITTVYWVSSDREEWKEKYYGRTSPSIHRDTKGKTPYKETIKNPRSLPVVHLMFIPISLTQAFSVYLFPLYGHRYRFYLHSS
jgi:hypothetical protein